MHFKRDRILRSLWLLGLVMSLALLGPKGFEGVSRNIFYLQLSHTLAGAPISEDSLRLPETQENRPEVAYGLGLLAKRVGQDYLAERLWRQALYGDSRYVFLVRPHAGTSLPLAMTAVAAHPDLFAAWDWMGDAVSPADPALALQYYLKAVQLAPWANLVWEKIGALAEQQRDFRLALAASQRACDINPIRNGSCLRAARLAFAAGDWWATVYYYERGSYPESVEGWLQLIRAAQYLGRKEDAERYLRMAQSEYPADYERLLIGAP
jgi:tetratricopeptide (TPR) repeat protein